MLSGFLLWFNSILRENWKAYLIFKDNRNSFFEEIGSSPIPDFLPEIKTAHEKQMLLVRIPLGPLAKDEPLTIPVERFLYMLRFNSKGKLDELPDLDLNL